MAPVWLKKIFVPLVFAGSLPACGPDGTEGTPAQETGGARTPVAVPTASGAASTSEPWQARPGGPSLEDHVVERARALAAAPYMRRTPLVSRTISDLSYGQMRGISFRRDSAVWRGTAPFELQFFHPGGGNDLPVRIHLVEDGASAERPFRPGDFRYGDEVQGTDVSVPPEAGYAGFRVLHPLNDPDRMDEVVSFLGASYFRLLGPGQVYGLSSRGIAVDVAQPGGEEFPDFVEFWVRRPEPGDTTLLLHGLLDGPSIAGAYHFRLIPGDPETGRGTLLVVEAHLFARRAIGKLGVAPLTSMYLHGTLRPGGEDDFRPRVHDSQGLLMHTSRDEWIWRPLTNGISLRATALRDVHPVGFGLVQRDRDFAHYLDLETRYDRRPSQWVAPDGAWGGGGVELIEIPTESEFNDNIVAYWAPDGGISPGDPQRYRYRLITFDEQLQDRSVSEDPAEGESEAVEGESMARVVRTRIGWDGLPGQADPPPRSHRRIVVDFTGGPLDRIPASTAVEASVTASSGTLRDVRVLSLPGGGARVTFGLIPEGSIPADLRLFLRVGEAAVSETWSYLWDPENVR